MNMTVIIWDANCSSIGNKESYHFKELGQAVYDGSGKICNLPETISKDIELLKRDHLHPETGK